MKAKRQTFESNKTRLQRLGAERIDVAHQSVLEMKSLRRFFNSATMSKLF
jgi:hypothetical protein